MLTCMKFQEVREWKRKKQFLFSPSVAFQGSVVLYAFKTAGLQNRENESMWLYLFYLAVFGGRPRKVTQ